MLSRIFWVGIAGMALVVGMVIQDGDWIFDSVERELTVEQAVATDVPPETRRALADAVGRLVKAQAELAMLKVGDESAAEIQAAETRRAEARADVDRLEAEIRNQGQAAAIEQKAVRDQVRTEIREGVRTTIREAVGN